MKQLSRPVALLSGLAVAPALAVPAIAADFHKSPETVQAAVQTRLDASQKILDQVVAVKAARTVANTLEPLNDMSRNLYEASALASLMENTHPDPAVREVAEKANQDVQKFVTDLSLNKDVFKAVQAVDVSKADASTQRLHKNTLRDYRRAGVDRDDATREKIRVLREELVKLGQEFDRNIREDRRFIELDSAADLDGLPQDFIDAHKPGENGKIKITTDYPDYFPIQNYAKKPEVRRDIYMEMQNRAYPANETTLMTILAKRYELAQLLGYKTWADYLYEDKMTKDVKTVTSFIDQLDQATARRGEQDMALLLAAKRRDFPGADTIEDWERFYYFEQVKAQDYSFDSQSLRPYFNYPDVKKGILGLTETLFQVKITDLPDEPVWHPSVTAHEISDENGLIGKFYLDMHPREGKYGHAAAFPLVPGVKGKQVPQATLVCNFPEPDENGVALMEHEDVETFLHEFGHLLHGMFGGHQRWVDQSGVATEWDFVEAPSQMLEEWAKDAKTLQTFARHYETKQPIPADLIERMKTAEEFGEGAYVRRQNFLTAVSFNFHNRNPEGMNMLETFKDLQNKYNPYPYVEGTHMYASFGHLEGYSAMYYTYMWSLVIAKDLFSKFNPTNLMDPAVAMEYRHAVLEPGGSKDAADLVQDFLGRPYSFKSFEQWINKPRAN